MSASYLSILPYEDTVIIPCCSSAALLEPFRQDHDIRLTTAGAVAPGGPLAAAPGAGIAEMDRAPGGSSSLLHQNMVVATGEHEDPPGLYEKVLACVF